MINKHIHYHGLTEKEVMASRQKNGVNKLEEKKEQSFIIKVLNIFKEPMFLLLLVAASVYFLVGEYTDGIIMLIAVLAICFIEFVQAEKTKKALEELNKLSALNVKVIRNQEQIIVSSDEIVVGDIVVLEEGDSVPADGKVLYVSGLGINESTLTGESAIVYKNTTVDHSSHFQKNICYSGTSVVSGMGIIEIIAVGVHTELGKIGESLNKISNHPTPLEKQTNRLVFICTVISSIVFVFTIILNYISYNELPFSDRIVESILAGITIAMATIPEEIPVVLTVFLAMGSWRLAKKKTLTKSLKKIEALGSISVLCTDKTGTLTENKMVVQEEYSFSDTFYETAYLSNPEIAYDSMDIAIKKYCYKKQNQKEFIVTKEYPFTAEAKMMGILWNEELLCVKGAYETVLPLCHLNKKEYLSIEDKVNEYSRQGYRVIAIARGNISDTIPEKIQNVDLQFEGLLILDDPPRIGIKDSMNICNKAGIRIIMITGDSGLTAKGIAKKLDIQNYDEVITGLELESMSDEELYERVKTANIFARVYPNHKMRIVNALQKNGNVVAMTGDGVNDAPALKQADIGIAMGERGTNVAKEASDLILLDDNFNTIVKAIKDGRGIYNNIRKAIFYILVIHIPIALLSLFVPMFKLPTFLLPVHIMLLELLIDPTSSILFQRLKPTDEIMLEKPRNPKEAVIQKKDVIKCLLQGFYIFFIIFLNYYYLLKYGISSNVAITISYAILVISIILAAFQIKSDEFTIKTIIKDLRDMTTVLVNTFIILGLLLLIYVPFLNDIANTAPINPIYWGYILFVGFLTVLPFDLIRR